MRVIKGIVDVNWTRLGERLYQDLGWAAPKQGKFALLVRWDDFKNDWILVTYAVAPASGQLNTRKIEEALATQG